MGYIRVTTHLPTIDPNIQRDIQVSHFLPQKKNRVLYTTTGQ